MKTVCCFFGLKYTKKKRDFSLWTFFTSVQKARKKGTKSRMLVRFQSLTEFAQIVLGGPLAAPGMHFV